MTIKITERNFELPDYLEEHIHKAFMKLDKFSINFHSKDVFMKLEPEKNFHVEIATRSNLGQIDASADSKELIEALNEAFARLERQLIKNKEKPMSHMADHAEKQKAKLIADELEQEAVADK